MYITKNMYSRYAEYIDMKDTDFFHNILEIAKEKYLSDQEKFNAMNSYELDKLKSNETPVIFASTVASFSKEDDLYLSRPEMNDRARRKYLIIDADFAIHQMGDAQSLREKLIDLAERLNTPLVIYPTASYPDKPRFRAALFTKTALSEATYFQAMTWLYDQLGTRPSDDADFKIRSNNNAPMFVNDQQIEAIYDTTQNPDLELLDSTLWAAYHKPRIPTIKANKKSSLDEFTISDEILEEACLSYAKSDNAKKFSSFWRVLHSLARAEYYKQITHSQVQKALKWISAVPTADKYSRARWAVENINQYTNERRRVFSNEKILYAAKPLARITEFGDVFSKHQIV